jgi:hypothetical protein
MIISKISIPMERIGFCDDLEPEARKKSENVPGAARKLNEDVERIDNRS